MVSNFFSIVYSGERSLPFGLLVGDISLLCEIDLKVDVAYYALTMSSSSSI